MEPGFLVIIDMKHSRWQTLIIKGKVNLIIIIGSKTELITRGPNFQGVTSMANRYAVCRANRDG